MRRKTWWALAALCALAGSGWLVDEWRSPLLPVLAGLAVHLGVLGMVFRVVVGMRARGKQQRGGLLRIGAWGAILFGVPAVAAAAAGGSVSTFTQVLVYTLVPVVVVMTLAQRGAGFGEADGPLRLLPACLAGVGGAALLLPFALPSSATGWMWLMLIVSSAVAGAIAAVQLHGLLQGVDRWRAAAAVCGGAGLLAAVCCRVGWTGAASWDEVSVAVEAGRCLLVDGPVMLLTVWLLGDMPPAAFSARYLLIPLVTIVEGMVVLRPEMAGLPGWTMAAGLALLASGGLWLLRADQEEIQTAL